MYDFSKIDCPKFGSEPVSKRIGVGDVRQTKHSTGDESTKKVGKENAKVVGRKLRQGSEKRYRVSAGNSEEILHGNSTPPQTPSSTPTGITDVRQTEHLEGIDIDSIPTLNRSETSSLLYSGRKKKENVEIPITDKNFIENFASETSDELEVDESKRNDLTHPLIGINLNELDSELIRAKAELCKKSFAFFIQEFWDVIETAKLKWNWHMDFLAGRLQEIAYRVANRRKKTDDLIINVPPSSSKTTLITKLFPVYCWTIDPTISFITSMYNGDLALRYSNASRDLLKNEKFKSYFPNIVMKENQDNKGDYENKNGGKRFATAVGAAVTGRHCLISICDDPQDPSRAASEVERGNTNQWISQTLSSRMEDRDVTTFIYVQQRLHVNDATGFLLSQGLPYEHICLPAQVNSQVKPASVIPFYEPSGLLDVNRITHEALDRELVKLGSKQFQTQYNQSPNDEENAIIKEKWFPKVTQLEFDTLLTSTKGVIDFYLDTAYTKKTNRDPSAILACAKIGSNLYITGVKADRYEFPKLIQHIKNWTGANGYSSRSRIIVEPKASGISVIQQLKAETALNVIQGKDSKEDKMTRLNAISAIVEAGRVILVDGPWNRSFLEEVTADEPVHDDQRDCLVAAIETTLSRKATFRTVIR